MPTCKLLTQAVAGQVSFFIGQLHDVLCMLRSLPKVTNLLPPSAGWEHCACPARNVTKTSPRTSCLFLGPCQLPSGAYCRVCNNDIIASVDDCIMDVLR